MQVVPDSFTDAKDYLGESFINLNFGSTIDYEIIEEILKKHPDLVNFEYKQRILDKVPQLVNFEKEQGFGFYGTPLLLACEQYGYDEGKFLNCYSLYERLML